EVSLVGIPVGNGAGPNSLDVSERAFFNEDGVAAAVRYVAQTDAAVAVEAAVAGRGSGADIRAAAAGVTGWCSLAHRIPPAVGDGERVGRHDIGRTEKDGETRLNSRIGLHRLRQIELTVERILVEVRQDISPPPPPRRRIGNAIYIDAARGIAGRQFFHG